MSRASAQHWMAVAADCMTAATNLLAEHPRSACSRFYYAAYSAAHALLLGLGEHPPIRGNWSHEAIGRHLSQCLRRRSPAHVAGTYRQSIEESYRLRTISDYGPHFYVGSDEAREARRLAGHVMELARRRIG